jgi:nucleoside-diphosphate-sugar epimerase
LSTRKHDSQNQGHIHIVTADLLDTEAYRDCLQDTDLIIHMAALTHTNKKQDYYRINTEGTRRLVELAKENNVQRFIFLSTRAIAKEGGAYSDSKRLAENIVKKSGLNWLIIRPAEIYGINGGEAITKLVLSIEKMVFVPIISTGQYRITPVHINDVVSALIRAIENKDLKNRIYTLAGPEDFAYKEFVDLISKIKKKKRIKIHLPILSLRIVAHILAMLKIKRPFIVRDQIPRLIIRKSSDISAAQADLDFHPQKISQFIE